MNRKESPISPIADQAEVFVFFGPIRAVSFKADEQISEYIGKIVPVKEKDTIIDLGFDSSYFLQENKTREDMDMELRDLGKHLGNLATWLKRKNLKPDTVISGFTNEHMAHVSRRYGFTTTEIEVEDEQDVKEGLAKEVSNAGFWKRKLALEREKGIPADIGKTMFCFQRLDDFVKRFDNGSITENLIVVERPLAELTQQRR